MKKITKIEYQKKNKERFNIYIDDEYGFAVDISILIKYSLKKGMELDDALIDEILLSEEEISVYNYGISVLSRYFKSEYELRLKMKNKGFNPQLIDNAISILKERKYLDDERYCEMFINDKINISKHGVRKIKEALYYKGIDKEIIEEKIKCISAESEEERALLLGEKKLLNIKENDNRKKMSKLSNYLLGKGFEYETVNKTLRKLLNADNDFY
ncbi:MAG TPA: RecX family transcriptional regulator [Sedimentibacter sp.]|jgi:regulatory protein|nr:RecX family transcriptional regulator [Sedimentibacter sp.]HQK53254.1 RecX family transcriptional regulator [Sedimentibacter sp.]